MHRVKTDRTMWRNRKTFTYNQDFNTQISIINI